MKAKTVMQDSIKIITSRALTNSGDQAWDFAVPVSLAVLLPQQLETVALVFLLIKALHLFLLPLLGNWLDQLKRPQALQLGLLLQFVGVCLQTFGLLWISQQKYMSILVIIGGGVMSAAGSTMTNIAIAQDLVPSLYSGSMLSKINSRIRQVDLLCEVLAPIMAGLLLMLSTSSNPYLGLCCVALWNLISFVPEYFLVQSVLQKNSSSLKKVSVLTIQTPLWKKLSAGWGDLFRLPVAPIVVAYALLWISVLSPHGVLLTSFLKEVWQVPEMILGLFRGLGAIFGIVATLIFPVLVVRWGLLKTGWISLLLQSIFVFIAFVGFQTSNVVLFLGAILLSRVGLYSFSLAEQQMRQNQIPMQVRGAVNATASALTSFATLILFALGAVFGSANQFKFLIYFSVICVFIALFIVSKNTKSSQ